MTLRSVAPCTIGPADCQVTIGKGSLAVICGPCVIESEEHILRHAASIREICSRLSLPLVFKSSFDKANRTSGKSFRGPGIEEGLHILKKVRETFQVPVITDVHTEEQARLAAEVVDVLQIPAFLCRQTDLLLAAAATKKPVLVKKGQFVHPEDMQHAVTKIQQAGNSSVMLCERGSVFGYRELVVDFRALSMMRSLGVPVVFDATHSVQIMGGQGERSGGNRSYVPSLARAAVSVGIDALFLEAHENPDTAPSDGPNMIPLSELESLLSDCKALSTLSLKTREG